MLAGAVAGKRFKPIARRHPQVIEPRHGVDQEDLSDRPFQHVGRNALDGYALIDAGGAAISEALDHRRSVLNYCTPVNREGTESRSAILV